ncbi:MAG: WG repeat-containing protein [Bacillota bacterium]|nr:WG repeat-containing protein [Bacillota bacterium]
MKKTAMLLALSLVFVLMAPAMAEVSLEEVFKAPGEDLKFIDTELDEPLVLAYKDKKYGVYNEKGENIIPFEYGRIAHLGSGLFEVIKEKGLNNHALINLKNEVIVDFLYGAYELISPELVAAVTLEKAEGEVYDYSSGFLGGGDKYIVKTYDIYNVLTREKLGSFERADYDSSRAVDGHLAVKNRDDKVTVYDMSLQPVTTTNYLFDLEYDLKDEGGVKNLAGKYSNQVIAENVPYTSVSTSGNDGFLVVRGPEGAGLINTKGQLLVPAVYDSIYATSAFTGYVVVVDDSLKGVADLEGNLLVPAKYTEITTRFNRVFFNGYALVELDGKLGYVNMKGEETLPVTYSKSATVHGASLSLPDLDGSLYIISADGVKTKTEYESFEQYFSDGTILKAQKGNTYDLVDWHGNVIFEGLSYSDLEANKSGGYVLYQDTLYKVAAAETAVETTE